MSGGTQVLSAGDKQANLRRWLEKEIKDCESAAQSQIKQLLPTRALSSAAMALAYRNCLHMMGCKP